MNNRPGFTLKEFLILIAIVALLVGMVVPAVQKVREAERRTATINNMKQVLLATHGVNDVYKKLPPASGIFGGMTVVRSLSIHLLPYVESSPLYGIICVSGPPKTGRCYPYGTPADATTTDFLRVQNFAGNVRVFTDIGVNTSYDAPVIGIVNENDGTCTSSIPKSFPDGTSNTILYATRCANTGAVTSGGDVNCSTYDGLVAQDYSAFFGVNTLSSPAAANSTGGWQLAPSLSEVNCQFGAVAHSFGISGIQVGLGDATVRTISPGISPFLWNCLVQPNDGTCLEWSWNGEPRACQDR